ncbi:CS1-pili formation C-terminal domain-containing protein [Photobacterium profundum]|uniref:CS1-pili formation C-terminal domain-containing protein n=1 Tax=Photobacterium profundum TaxID=74109 RepID=UPI0012F4C799|nr:CS1-pili formation C-terminal domain-containing protein [Photobacterium profundum]
MTLKIRKSEPIGNNHYLYLITQLNPQGDSAISGYANKSWGNYSSYLSYRKNTYKFDKQAKDHETRKDTETASFSLNRNFYSGGVNSAISLYSNYNVLDDQFESGRISYRTEMSFWEIGLHDVRVETGFNYGQYMNSRDSKFEDSVDIRVTIPIDFGSSKRANISTNYDHSTGAELMADYHQTFENSLFRYASVKASTDEYSNQLTGRTGFETYYIRGDVGATVTSNSTSGYTNLNGSIGVSGDGVGMGSNSSAESGVLVTVNPEAIGNIDLVTRTDRYTITASPLFIPLASMTEHELEFDNTRGASADNFNIKHGKKRFVAYSGNVLNLNAEFYKTAAVFGQLVDANGNVMQYVKIKSKEKTTFTDESGQFSIEPFDNETMLIIEHDDGQTETISIGELNKPVNFVGRKQVQHKSG